MTYKQFQKAAKQFQKAAIKEFRETYTIWDDVPDEDLQICENGEIYIGNTQFKIDTKLKNFL